MQIDHIYNADCTSMDAIPEGAVDMILAGPPYWDYIDYNAYLKGDDYVWRRSCSYEEFLSKLGKWFIECCRVLKPGRYCIVNLGTVRHKGRCYPLPFHAVAKLEEAGFEFCYEIIWHKVSGGRQHARNFVQKPYPGYFIPNNRVEYLLVTRKMPTVDFYRPGQEKPAPFIIDEHFTRDIANDVWHIMPSCHPYNGDHPCPFPPEIPLRLIPFFSLPGEIVLDPFMGIGTTARACRMLDRRFIGYEIEQGFINIALENIDIPLPFRKPVRWGKSDAR